MNQTGNLKVSYVTSSIARVFQQGITQLLSERKMRLIYQSIVHR